MPKAKATTSSKDQRSKTDFQRQKEMIDQERLSLKERQQGVTEDTKDVKRSAAAAAAAVEAAMEEQHKNYLESLTENQRKKIAKVQLRLLAASQKFQAEHMTPASQQALAEALGQVPKLETFNFRVNVEERTVKNSKGEDVKRMTTAALLELPFRGRLDGEPPLKYARPIWVEVNVGVGVGGDIPRIPLYDYATNIEPFYAKLDSVDLETPSTWILENPDDFYSKITVTQVGRSQWDATDEVFINTDYDKVLMSVDGMSKAEVAKANLKKGIITTTQDLYTQVRKYDGQPPTQYFDMNGGLLPITGSISRDLPSHSKLMVNPNLIAATCEFADIVRKRERGVPTATPQDYLNYLNKWGSTPPFVIVLASDYHVTILIYFQGTWYNVGGGYFGDAAQAGAFGINIAKLRERLIKYFGFSEENAKKIIHSLETFPFGIYSADFSRPGPTHGATVKYCGFCFPEMFIALQEYFDTAKSVDYLFDVIDYGNGFSQTKFNGNAYIVNAKIYQESIGFFNAWFRLDMNIGKANCVEFAKHFLLLTGVNGQPSLFSKVGSIFQPLAPSTGLTGLIDIDPNILSDILSSLNIINSRAHEPKEIIVEFDNLVQLANYVVRTYTYYPTPAVMYVRSRSSRMTGLEFPGVILGYSALENKTHGYNRGLAITEWNPVFKWQVWQNWVVTSRGGATRSNKHNKRRSNKPNKRMSRRTRRRSH